MAEMDTPVSLAIGHARDRKTIRDAILSCTRCDALSPNGTAPVPFRGPSPNRVMVLGEAPGKQEDLDGRPFVGPSGQSVARALAKYGVNVDDWFITNTVRCYPGGTPTSSHVMACLVHLRAEVRMVQPEWVLCLGAVALSVATTKKVTAIHGRPFEVKMGPLLGRKVFPCYHPAAGLRSPTVQRVMEMDLGTFAGIVKGEVDWKEYRL